MKLVKTTDKIIELAGTAKEFSSLARAIKKSKVASICNIDLDGAGESIKLSCTKLQTRISIDSSIKIEFTEKTKNQLHALITIPSDTASDSRFFIIPTDHNDIFSEGSIGMVLHISESI